MTSDLEKLLDYLIVEEIEENVFCGNSPKRPARVFGGQVLAQALNAATKTVSPDRLAHSMHASFLRPGNPGKQIKYEVNLTRDGRSFTTRNVLALQDDVEIFSTSVSFHIEEAGLSHHTDMPQVPPPEELETDFSRWSKLAEEFPDKFDVPTLQPIERRPVNPRDFFNPEPGEPQQKIWFRALGSLNDDLRTHQIVLAYMSDFGLLGTTLMPHPFNGMQKNMQSASLDHALWFHRPFRADEFLLYSLDSPVSAGGRGFSRGSFYTREGLLVASTAQECLIRTVQN